ncbi:MAG: hypothetical protein IT442_02345 [Phycisphaeraceae bacterium]|nr:hypothetical protein [Phycisphaeraceae bacterium]
MSHGEPSIRVNVDVTNPGQFFACCGLLELADRLWPGAEGWFNDDWFYMLSDEPITSCNRLISSLLSCPELSPKASKTSFLKGSKLKLLPFPITFPTGVLRIDWWRDELAPPKMGSRETCNKSIFKTWAGNQSPHQIVYDRLLPAMQKVMRTSGDWFHSRVSLAGRFGFDHTSAVKSLDVGWSSDKHEITVHTSPAIELLAMIGLQRFRPSSRGYSTFMYSTWDVPASALCAAAFASGVTHYFHSHGYRFTIEERGDYKYFSPATFTGVTT